MFFVTKVEIPQRLKEEIKDFEEHIYERSSLSELYSYPIRCINHADSGLGVCEESEEYDIVDKIRNTDLTETFQTLLFNFIDSSGLSDSEVYNRAFINRRLFSKIRSDKDYHPSFGTVTLFALALKLSISDYKKLLNSASYALPTNSYAGITLKYCFENKIYDVIRVNNLVYTVCGREIREL